MTAETQWTAAAQSETGQQTISIPGVITAPDENAATKVARSILQRKCEEAQVYRAHFPNGAAGVAITVSPMKVKVAVE
jgi:hypothetical protein